LDVLGPLSLMFWSLIVMVCFKYLGFITRATNQGEGGMFALLTLFPIRQMGLQAADDCRGGAQRYFRGLPALRRWHDHPRHFGSLGGGRPRPAGCSTRHRTGQLRRSHRGGHHLWLFLVQKNGTARIGVAFGPIMVLWFLTLAVLGIINISAYPGVFAALLPHHGVNFLLHHGHESFVLMGLVLLAVTGCEAMYADIGHFGRPPLVKSWFVIVLPALLLNYLGQGLSFSRMSQPRSKPGFHHFFSLVPKPALIPVILLATAATIIASQAMITGVYSLTQQAVQLGYLPR
jgi:KUP system potassium uptake protein